MQARGYAELTTTELPDELQFTVVRHDGWMDWALLVASPALLVLYWYLQWRYPNNWWFVSNMAIFFTIGFIVSPLLRWFHGRTTVLRVTRSELVATGNLREMFSRRVAMRASAVRWLGFDQFRAAALHGFVMQGNLQPLYALPGLSREQAEGVADAILRKFPNIRPDMPR